MATPTPIDRRVYSRVKSILDTYGREMTLTCYTGSVPDGTTRKVTRTGTSQAIKGSPPSPWDQSWGATTIEAGVISTIIAAKGLTSVPKLGDIITDSQVGMDWTIDKVHPIASGNQVSAYILELSR